MLYLVLIGSDSRLFAQKQTPSQQKFQADPEPTEIPDHLWKICSEN
jgi:hypothetical protein